MQMAGLPWPPLISTVESVLNVLPHVFVCGWARWEFVVWKLIGNSWPSQLQNKYLRSTIWAIFLICPKPRNTWYSKHSIFFSHGRHLPLPPAGPAIPLLTPVTASPWEPWCVLGPPGFSYSGEALSNLCLYPAPLAIPTSWPTVCLHLKRVESSGGQRLTETNASLPGGLTYTVVKQPPNLDRHTGRAPLEEHLAGP